MRYLIILLFLTFFALSCKKTEEIQSQNQSILLYNKQMLTKPISTDSGFYFIAINGETVNISNINTSGEYSSLFNISDLFPSGYTIDSMSNIALQFLPNKNLVAQYTYTENSKQKISLIKISQTGTMLWHINDSSILTQQNAGNSLNLCSTENSDIMLVSTGSNQGGLSINQNVFSGTDGQLVSQKSMMKNGNLIALFPLQSGNYVCLLRNSNQGPGGGEQLTQSTTILKFNESQRTDSLSIGINLFEITSLSETTSGLLFTGYTGDMKNGLSTAIINMDTQNGMQWQAVFSSVNIAPVCIKKTDGGYYVIGTRLQTQRFSWNLADLVSALEGSTLYLAKIDENGNFLWEQEAILTEMAGCGIIENSNKTLTLISLFLVHDSFLNIAIHKTDLDGNILE